MLRILCYILLNPISLCIPIIFGLYIATKEDENENKQDQSD